MPGLASLFGFDMSGRLATKAREEATEETKAVRQHTTASLFNALHNELQRGGRITRIGGLDQLASLRVGELVEVNGAFVGNAFERLIAFFSQLLPYLDMEAEKDASPENGHHAKRSKPHRSGNPKRRAEADQEVRREQLQALTESAQKREEELNLHLLRKMAEDVRAAAVHDAVIEGPGGLQVVLTLPSEFFSEATGEYLRAGSFAVLGKVTRILAPGDEINLSRRTVVGAAGPEMTREMIETITKSEEVSLDTGDPIIEPPAIQVLPAAIYI